MQSFLDSVPERTLVDFSETWETPILEGFLGGSDAGLGFGTADVNVELF